MKKVEVVFNSKVTEVAGESYALGYNTSQRYIIDVQKDFTLTKGNHLVISLDGEKTEFMPKDIYMSLLYKFNQKVSDMKTLTEEINKLRSSLKTLNILLEENDDYLDGAFD